MMKKELITSENIKAISADASARALYFTYSDNPVAKTVRKSEHMSIDYDKNGKIVGIECIRVKSAEIKLAVKKAFQDVNKVIDRSLKEVSV